jgi:hypothetical protein
MGQRLPASTDAQKISHMKFYLAHESAREVDPGMLIRAQRMSQVLAK